MTAYAVVQVEGMKMVVSKSSQVDYCRHLVHKALGRAVKDKELHTSTHQEVTQCLKDIRVRGGGTVQPAAVRDSQEHRVSQM